MEFCTGIIYEELEDNTLSKISEPFTTPICQSLAMLGEGGGEGGGEGRGGYFQRLLIPTLVSMEIYSKGSSFSQWQECTIKRKTF